MRADPETFTWWGHRLTYEHGDYNNARENERAVEIPIARRWLTGRLGGVLEVGNVLGHYGIDHGGRIVDRYEQAPGIENLDLFDIQGSFGAIVAVSTVEHVRWDEPDVPRDDQGSRAAIEHLATLLRPGGRMLITVPLGHHPGLDAVLPAAPGTLGADWVPNVEPGWPRACTFVRDSLGGWVQTDRPEWRPYGVGQPWANSVWIGEWQAPHPLAG